MARVLIVQGHARSRADTAATRRAEGHDGLRSAVLTDSLTDLDGFAEVTTTAGAAAYRRGRHRPRPGRPRLTASFGVVEHRPADAWRDLLTRAETALVRAKRAGRHRCEMA
jgi:GGDEF domain-containing protein